MDVTVQDVDLVSATSSTSEITISAPLNTPHPLRAGTNTSFSVGYQAGDLGQDTAEIEISLRDFPHALVVPLQGEGAMDPRITDTFKQRDTQAVDILFVIDDSCSMIDNQQALASNIRSFIMQANLRQVDFQIRYHHHLRHHLARWLGRAGDLQRHPQLRAGVLQPGERGLWRLWL